MLVSTYLIVVFFNCTGKRGVFSTSGGLKLAYVSGVESSESSPCGFTAADVVRVRDSCIKGQPSYRGIDILLTSQWPQGVTQRDEKCVSVIGMLET